jgi:glycine/D-amino acid oxidase-like deaminating enzyme
MVSFSKPECQIDKSSNLHVLYQTGARSFNYSVINPDGRLLVRQTYDYSDTRPVLRIDREGRILIGGGVRRSSSDDLPPPADASTNDAKTPKP